MKRYTRRIYCLAMIFSSFSLIAGETTVKSELKVETEVAKTAVLEEAVILEQQSIDILVAKYQEASEKDAPMIMKQIREKIATQAKERQAAAIDSFQVESNASLKQK